MDSEDVVRRYYTKLFLLPGTPVLVAVYLAVTSAIAVAEVVPSLDPTAYLGNVLRYLKSFTAFLLLNTALTRSSTLNSRRALGLTTVLITVFSIPEVAFSKVLGLRGLGVLASSGLSLLILLAFISPLRALTVSSVPQLATYLLVNEVPADGVWVYLTDAFLTQMSSIAVSAMTLAIIEVRGRSLLGIEPVRLLKSFLASWFSRDAGVLETEFMRYSQPGEVLVRIAAIRRYDDEDILLLFPTVHYGPFRNVGSSRLIYHIEELLGNRYYVYVFHTPGSHERNLTSSTYSVEVARYLNTFINGFLRGLAELKPCLPYTVSYGSWSAYVIPFPTGLVAFLSNAVDGGDDIPYVVWDLINSRRDTYVNAVVDTHSFKGPRVRDAGVFKGLMNRVLDSYRCVEVGEFMAGHGESYVGGFCRGLCFGKVKALVMDFDGMRYVLVYVYGNNMEGGFREVLVREVRSMGVDYVEVVTPDDHSCAASFRESPYDVVSYCDGLIGAVREAVTNAVANVSRARLVTADVVLTNVRLVGDKVWDMVNALEVLGRTVYRYIAVSVVTMFLTPLALILIP